MKTSRQYWKYEWRHNPSGKTGISTTKDELTPLQFLSLLCWWNCSDDWTYIPCTDNLNILPQHMCYNNEDCKS
jgi:hypothetical protein